MSENSSWDVSGSFPLDDGIFESINRLSNCRVTPESDIDDDLDGSVLSLGLFPGEYLDSSSAMSGSGVADDRVIFRFEAAWDSSLHNSLLLNRVTPAGETIYMTISAYLQVRSTVHSGE